MRHLGTVCHLSLYSRASSDDNGSNSNMGTVDMLTFLLRHQNGILASVRGQSVRVARFLQSGSTQSWHFYDCGWQSCSIQVRGI